jgi:hypothetical protein
VLNDTGIISFQILVGPCKGILILSGKFEIGLPFLFRYCLVEIYVFGVFRGPKIYSFMHGIGQTSFVNWLFPLVSCDTLVY